MGFEDRLPLGVALPRERVVVPSSSVELDDDAVGGPEHVGTDRAALEAELSG